MERQSARAAANDGIADGNAGERRLGGEPVSGDRIKSTTPLIEIRKTESMVQRRLGEPRAMMEGGGGDGSHTADDPIRRRSADAHKGDGYAKSISIVNDGDLRAPRATDGRIGRIKIMSKSKQIAHCPGRVKHGVAIGHYEHMG